MNAARENILARVRAAIATPAPRPPMPADSAIWPPVDDLETRFRQEFTALKGEIIESLPDFLAGFPKIATDGSELTPAGNATPRAADLGVTGCECLVAQTGSIIVSRHRVVSVLPPVHLVIARREQIVVDLNEAMALLRKRFDGHWPSTLAVISGPSRTADIEKILVLGAHGPKRIALHFAV
jgi:L-lactate dehydrogenase complex protein LldG